MSACRKECNKYDLAAAQCFRFAHHNNWSRWFAISSLPPIRCPSFSFIAGVAKEYITKLGCEKYFSRVTYWGHRALCGSCFSCLRAHVFRLCTIRPFRSECAPFLDFYTQLKTRCLFNLYFKLAEGPRCKLPA